MNVGYVEDKVSATNLREPVLLVSRYSLACDSSYFSNNGAQLTKSVWVALAGEKHMGPVLGGRTCICVE